VEDDQIIIEREPPIVPAVERAVFEYSPIEELGIQSASLDVRVDGRSVDEASLWTGRITLFCFRYASEGCAWVPPELFQMLEHPEIADPILDYFITGDPAQEIGAQFGFEFGEPAWPEHTRPFVMIEIANGCFTGAWVDYPNDQFGFLELLLAQNCEVVSE